MAFKFKKGIDLQGQKGINGADPTNPTDLATKQYTDNVANGRDWKESVRGASTGNLAITALVNGLVHDGVTYVTGDSILLKNNTTASENGPYTIGASGTGTRRGDFDTSSKATPGATFTAEEGTVNGDKRFVLTTNAPIVLGTTALVFTVDAGGGTTYTAGSGLAESPAGTFNIGAGNGITVNADDIQVNTAVVVRKYAADCAATTNPQTFTHGLGTNDITFTIWQKLTATTYEEVKPDVTKDNTAGTLIVDWGSAPAAGDYRVVAHG